MRILRRRGNRVSIMLRLRDDLMTVWASRQAEARAAAMVSDDRDTPRASLISQIGRAARTRASTIATPAGIGWRAEAGVAALLVSAPLLTIGGAWWIERQVRNDTAEIARSAAPRLAVARDRAAALATLTGLLARPSFGATIETLARTLPADVTLTKATWVEGRLRIEVAAPDPDRLRIALRRDPVTAGLRDAGQSRGDGGMIVVLEEAR